MGQCSDEIKGSSVDYGGEVPSTISWRSLARIAIRLPIAKSMLQVDILARNVSTSPIVWSGQAARNVPPETGPIGCAGQADP